MLIFLEIVKVGSNYKANVMGKLIFVRSVGTRISRMWD